MWGQTPSSISHSTWIALHIKGFNGVYLTVTSSKRKIRTIEQ